MLRRRTLTTLAAAAAALTLMSACSTPSESGDLKDFSIEGAWTLASGSGPDGDIAPVADAPIKLEVDGAGKASGNGGCNNLILGDVAVEGTKVSFGMVGSTMMACDEAIMKVETAYIGALEKVAEGSIDEGQLVLTGPDTELRYDAAS